MQGVVRTTKEGGLREVHHILGLRQAWNENILCRLFGVLLQSESLVVLLLLYRQMRVLLCRTWYLWISQLLILLGASLLIMAISLLTRNYWIRSSYLMVLIRYTILMR